MSLLSGEQIRGRVFDHDAEQIVCRSTFDDRRLRAAAYDLRIAADELIPPNSTTPVPPGEFYDEILELQPGDVAWVSTYDRFCMPWDLAGNISPKFSFARKGLFIFTGLLVDPGFGLRKVDDRWVADEDERLSFPITNIGPSAISINLGADGDELLSLQVLSVTPPPDDRRREVTRGRGGLRAQSQARPLEFFRHVRSYEERTTAQIGNLEKECRRLDIVVESTRASTDQLVVFGFVLLGITLLGVSLSILVEAPVGDRIRALSHAVGDLHLSTGTIVLAIALGACVAAVLIALLRAMVKCVDLLLKYRRDAELREQDAKAVAATAQNA
jgi:hypothetical protein